MDRFRPLVRPQIAEYFARMNAKTDDDSGVVNEDEIREEDIHESGSPLASNLRWEAGQKRWKLPRLITEVEKYLSTNEPDLDATSDSIAVTVKRHWEGKSRNPKREYKEAYQHLFGYDVPESIKHPLHIQRRRKSSLKPATKDRLTSTVFQAAGEAKEATVDESIELAKELLNDPEWSPYISMALHFLKLNR